MTRYFEDYVEATKRKFRTTVSTLTINTETFKIGSSVNPRFSQEKLDLTCLPSSSVIDELDAEYGIKAKDFIILKHTFI